MPLRERSYQSDSAPWLQAAQQGTPIVTSNQRAARTLQQQSNALAAASGIAGWHTASILPWDSWLLDTWQGQIWRFDPAKKDSAKKTFPPLLLSHSQEQLLWERTIARDHDASPLNLAALAGLCQQAWGLLHDYAHGASTLPRYAVPRLDWQKFRTWAADFAHQLHSNGWITHAELPAALLERFQAGHWQAPASLVLWGFDHHTPAQLRLFEALQQHCKVHCLAPAVAGIPQPRAASLALANPQAEFLAAANWAADRLRNSPQARLAILTTRAADDRGGLHRALSSQLPPRSFSFSLGHPLAEFPLVQTALRLLRWVGQPLAPEEVSALLVARELARSEQEHRDRASFDVSIFRRRSLPDPSMSLADFHSWLLGLNRKASPAWLTQLEQQCRTALRTLPAKSPRMAADDWAARFRSILQCFALPGTLASSSVEFQTWDRLQTLLDDFASLSLAGRNFDAPTMEFSEAIDRISRLAAEAVFQPESTSTPVQVLGPLEAAGSTFDGLFFLGCSDDRWPLPVDPNPLLSLELQQAFGMPGAVRGETLYQGHQITDRLLHSATEVLFSSPLANSDGPVRPSTCLQHTAITQPHTLADLCPQPPHAPATLEPIPESPLEPWDLLRGSLSSADLRSQAACPFQAFALRRLKARDQDLPEEGLDAPTRGTLLHELLAQVWQSEGGLVTHAALLKAIAEGSLQPFVRSKADSIFSTAGLTGWQKELLALERERCIQLVCDWLEQVECHRAPFTVVATEKDEEFQMLGSLLFRVRLDRIDRIDQSDALTPSSSDATTPGLVLIDYKSGSANANVWQPARMDEPQLPLYAIHALGRQNPVALAFASLRGTEKPRMLGLSSLPGLWPGLKDKDTSAEEFALSMEAWAEDLLSLAEGFAAGNPQVDPKHGGETCKRCHLQSLCRIHEANELLDSDTQDEEPDND